MTDKTSTATVMSLQDLRAILAEWHLRGDGFLHVSRAWEFIAAIDAHLNAPTPDVVGIDSYPISGRIYKRRDEWVMEINGTINDTYFSVRHTQPGEVAPEDVAELSSLYPDVVGGDVVACRYRVVAPNGNVGKWFFTDEACVSSGCLEVQPLYAAPRVQGEIIAWVTPQGDRSLTAAQKAGMEADGGAGKTSVRPFSVPAYAGSRVQGDADHSVDLRQELKYMVRAYVRLLEVGRDRIVDLGGSCDPLDVMEQGDPNLIQAKRALAAPRQAVPDGWKPIETAPTDGVVHARGLHVKTNRGWYFDVVAGYVDESGQFADLNGDITRWETDDYEYWHPLAAAPSAERMGVES